MPQSSNTSRALSPARVIARFAVRVVLLGAFAAFGSIGFGRSLVTLLWMSIILCAAVAILRREQLFGAVLNHWDECAAFGALFALVHLVNAQS
ncbi:hypothetical protein QA649_13180 [Bradyrhizobium sp. CB1717]|uniref:hypothetical protein n=1 Tax=Bradyrhizobium sp. CB1717 TaxID=3039154 RepID=UPI0024B1BC74|nr:hypothetical protein [Bradyrhizobium sp. CB1717]WFU27116.1 hypothetical protein QA649_13180 [Bradyrhizobium sp. CB1717]